MLPKSLKNSYQIDRQFIRSNWPPILAIGVSGMVLFYTLVIRFLQHYRFIKGPHDFWPPVVLWCVLLLCWSGINIFAKARNWLGWANGLFLLVLLWMSLYVIYRHTADWLGWVDTLTQTYWDQLANSFLQGKLYLENPTYFHDLTRFQGHWYVPNPPLPAFLMIPLILIGGIENVNAVRYSILYAATNGLLLLLILDQSAHLGWISLKRPGRLWLVALFALGTPHWYVGINGQMWFFSQVVTVTFTALAVFAAMKRWSPLLAGASLAFALCARPDVALLWPCLVFIYYQHIFTETNRLDWAALFKIVIQVSIPIGIAVFGLLFYNHARFDNWLDFGYVTINGAEQIVKDAQAYGIFNVHFIPRNLNVMLLGFPEIRLNPFSINPSRDGMSIFLTTPAFLYLFRKQGLRLWKIGALLSIGANIALLAMYHNTGNFQFGYSYLLDLIVPIFLILAAGFKEKVSLAFKLLVLLSILINFAGTIWFAANW